MGWPFSPQDGGEWAVIKSPPNPNAGYVTLGLLLDTDHAFSILNMGPSSESTEVNDGTSVRVCYCLFCEFRLLIFAHFGASAQSCGGLKMAPSMRLWCGNGRGRGQTRGLYVIR